MTQDQLTTEACKIGGDKLEELSRKEVSHSKQTEEVSRKESSHGKPTEDPRTSTSTASTTARPSGTTSISVDEDNQNVVHANDAETAVDVQSATAVSSCYSPWEKFASVDVEFVGMAGSTNISSTSATAETTVGMLRMHARGQVKPSDVELISDSRVLSNDQQKICECVEPSEAGKITLTCILRSGDPTDEEIQAEPDRYELHLHGHARQDCNGVYKYRGKENGKPCWGHHCGKAKVFWTFWNGRGHTWDIYWGGVSPENKRDSAVPPRSGWDGQGQPADTIKISYVRV